MGFQNHGLFLEIHLIVDIGRDISSCKNRAVDMFDFASEWEAADSGPRNQDELV